MEEQQVHRAERTRGTLEVLLERAGVGNEMPAGEVWRIVADTWPLNGYEAEVTRAGGGTRARKDWGWISQDLSENGWLQKRPDGSGFWQITEAGVQALREYADPQEFFRVMRAQSAAGRARLQEQIRDALPKFWVSSDYLQRRVIRVADLFVEQALKAGDSVFAPGRLAWSKETVEGLRSRWSAASAGPGLKFIENLPQQLAGAPDDEILLMAEVLTLQVLPISRAIGQSSKKKRIELVLGLMQHPVQLPRVIEEAFAGGSFNPGQGMQSNLPKAVTLILDLALAWLDLGDEAQEAALSDPLRWRELVTSLPGDSFPTQRYSLMYLAHPGFFGPVVAPEDRERIRVAFAGEIGGDAVGDPDVDLQRIVVALQMKDDLPVQFYAEPKLSVWKPGAATDAPQVDPAPTDGQALPADPRGFTVGDIDTRELSDELLFSEPWLSSVVRALHRRGQVILYGPPGTGKTYVAKAIANALAHAGGEVRRIQFHPSYTYEDFFAGYRPRTTESGQLSFELTHGPLWRVAEAARRNPDEPQILLIDEINRANLPKVFGELYYLLEYRDEEIDLLYQGSGVDGSSSFGLPPNVLVIGTMNTADRSIALLDSAMRRRFSFFELHPDTEPVAGILERWCTVHPQSLPIAELFAALNESVQDRDDKIGPSHLLRSDNFNEHDLEAIWKESLLPLLEERHFGTGVDVESRHGLPAIWRRVRSRQSPSETVDDE